MKKFLLTALLGIFTFTGFAQDIQQHISYTRIYDFLDELATDRIIELNSAIKPYSRAFIAAKLSEAATQDNKLNKRQRKELRFFTNEFALELDKLPESRLRLIRNNTTSIALAQPAMHYRDSLLRTRITPILGMHITRNANGSITKRWYGAEFQMMAGKHLSVYGSLRDISVNGPILARPTYLNDYPGYEYKESVSGGDYSDSRGGIKYGWRWGSIGLIKDNPVWGDNYHGSNILSGRTPSFPMLTLHLKPAKWFEMQYFHGWLVSNIADSTRYYVDNINVRRYRMANKFMAANMFTFTPVPRLNLSFGNSIVYAESSPHPAYFIPVAFYKSIDHTLTKGLGLENQNSQVFFNLSSRNIRHFHLYTSVYVDEVKFSRFKPGNPENNPVSVKAGAHLSNFPVKNLSLVGEFTRSNIINYKHSIPTITWASNGYNLGSYLGDNSQEMYISLRYKPLQGIDLSVSYIDAKHGNEYEYLRGGRNILKIISQPVLGDITWSNKTVALKGQFELVQNVYALLNLEYSDIRGYDAVSAPIAGENRLTGQGYLDLFTPKYLQGQNTTFTFGLSFGF